MQKSWVRKSLVCGILLLFVRAGVVPITNSMADVKRSDPGKKVFKF
jgi:hypothetical protein